MIFVERSIVLHNMIWGEALYFLYKTLRNDQYFIREKFVQEEIISSWYKIIGLENDCTNGFNKFFGVYLSQGYLDFS